MRADWLVVVWTDYGQSVKGRGVRGTSEMYLKLMMLKYIRVSTGGGAHIDSGRPLITECTVNPPALSASTSDTFPSLAYLIPFMHKAWIKLVVVPISPSESIGILGCGRDPKRLWDNGLHP